MSEADGHPRAGSGAMSGGLNILVALAMPLREEAVGELLEAVAAAIDSGADAASEPEARSATGKVMRLGPLRLPRRGDLSITEAGVTGMVQTQCAMPKAEPPVVVLAPDGFPVEVAPFRWDQLHMVALFDEGIPDWAPLRRWFLEWFQSRISDVAPDLLGAVHRIDGPRAVRGGWRFTIDLGSAPVAALPDLVMAMAATGATGLQLGPE